MKRINCSHLFAAAFVVAAAIALAGCPTLGPGGNGSAFVSLGSVALDAAGQLEVFEVRTDSANNAVLWQRQQTRNQAGITGWASWQSLGAPPGMTFGVSPVGNVTPVVARNEDGHLEVFLRNIDGSLWHIFQTTPENSPTKNGWSAWGSLGGSITSLPSVGMNYNGNLEVFAQGTDGALWHNWQSGAPSNITWSGWASLGGTCHSNIAVILNKGGQLNNCLEVFVIGNDIPINHMYTLFQTSPPSPGAAWSPWTSLGGYISGQPSVGQNPGGQLEVFAIGNDIISASNITDATQNSPGSSQWSGFSSLGTPSPGIDNDLPSAAVGANLDGDGHLELFALGSDGALWHNYKDPAKNQWSGWATLGVPGPGPGGGFMALGYPTIGNNQDGRLEVFVLAKDGSLWHIFQQPNPNGGPGTNGWSAWGSLGHP